MSTESTATPGGSKCLHPHWKIVEGAAPGPNGGVLVMCDKCNASRYLTPPVKESKSDQRPLLTEG